MIDPGVEQLLHELLTEVYGDRVEVNAKLAQLEAEDLLGAGEPMEPGGHAIFAQVWAKAITQTGAWLAPRSDLANRLITLTRQLAVALRNKPFSSQIARRAGQELVGFGIHSPEALGRTIDVFQRRFLTDLGYHGDDDHERLHGLISEFAVGFAKAMREVVLNDQDNLRQATSMVAWQIGEAKLRYAATHDELTGLPNRRFFIEHLSRLFQSSEPSDYRLGVCFLDLDRFKSVNDTLGHSIGDLVLGEIARRLIDRFPDHLVARLGGDEFVIVVSDTECEDDVVKIADAALNLVAEPILVERYTLRVSASIGIVERPLAGTDPDDVMRAADISLHWAKSDGRDRLCVFDPSRAEKDVARYRLAAAMPGALAHDQFHLVYEPVVRLSDGAVQGLEALLRWRHSELGDLSGASFLDLAEETGFAVPLGRWALSEACQQAMRWRRHFEQPLPVSMDISLRQLCDPGLVVGVRTALDRGGVSPAMLQLEISERAVTGMDREIHSKLRGLADMGVRLVLDDFGAGYFNLACLRTLPIDGLKLHPTLATNRHAPEMVSTIVRLAKLFGLTVTATGVETADDAQLLRAMGCDFGQGSRYSLAVSGEAVVAAVNSIGPASIRSDSRTPGAA